MKPLPLAAKKRDAFGKLIKLLNKLEITQWHHVPTVSNPYYLIHQDEIDEIIAKFPTKPRTTSSTGGR